jgi:hypothetical protein
MTVEIHGHDFTRKLGSLSEKCSFPPPKKNSRAPTAARRPMPNPKGQSKEDADASAVAY